MRKNSTIRGRWQELYRKQVNIAKLTGSSFCQSKSHKTRQPPILKYRNTNLHSSNLKFPFRQSFQVQKTRVPLKLTPLSFDSKRPFLSKSTFHILKDTFSTVVVDSKKIQKLKPLQNNKANSLLQYIKEVSIQIQELYQTISEAHLSLGILISNIEYLEQYKQELKKKTRFLLHIKKLQEQSLINKKTLVKNIQIQELQNKKQVQLLQKKSKTRQINTKFQQNHSQIKQLQIQIQSIQQNLSYTQKGKSQSLINLSELYSQLIKSQELLNSSSNNLNHYEKLINSLPQCISRKQLHSSLFPLQKVKSFPYLG